GAVPGPPHRRGARRHGRGGRLRPRGGGAHPDAAQGGLMKTGLRIVVADDEVDTREFFERYLPRLGHQVVAVAENGPELVERCRQSKPDLVITDLRMPGLDGLAAVEAVFREMVVPVIVVTAYADDAWVERAQQAGVFAYLVKPITEQELKPAIALAWRQF